jgi:2-haloacid dehalogenase
VPGQRITAAVFDLGGVLLDWDPRHLYRRLFADPGEMEDFLARSAPRTGTVRTTWGRTSRSLPPPARRYPGTAT